MKLRPDSPNREWKAQMLVWISSFTKNFSTTPMKNPVLYVLEEFAVQLNCETFCVLEKQWISGLNKFSLP